MAITPSICKGQIPGIVEGPNRGTPAVENMAAPSNNAIITPRFGCERTPASTRSIVSTDAFRHVRYPRADKPFEAREVQLRMPLLVVSIICPQVVRRTVMSFAERDSFVAA